MSLLETDDIPEQLKRSTSRKSAAKKLDSSDKSQYNEPIATMPTFMMPQSTGQRSKTTGKQPSSKRSCKGIS
ncbi:hypothetical protein FBU31_003428 [Coemansia sp. 'formosensis']|nr:hypothetical protein FBU31_003428 [Coemansia sp. 'formosensis']